MANGASTDTAQLLERSAQWDRPPRSMVVSSPVSHTRVGSRVTFDSLPTSPSPVAAAPTVSPLLAPATPTSPPLLVAVAAASLAEPTACESPTVLKHDKVEIRVGGEDVVVRLPSRSPQADGSPTPSEQVRENAPWNAATATSAGFLNPDAHVFTFINEARVFLRDKHPLSPTGSAHRSPATSMRSHSRSPSPSRSPMRGTASPRPLAEVLGMLKMDERAKSIPTLLPEDIESLPDSFHPGYNDYYYWRDEKKLEIDANRSKMVVRSKVAARCEEIRRSIPPALRLNPDARGIKGPELPPPAPLRYSKYTKPRFIRELEEMALHQAAEAEAEAAALEHEGR